MLAWKQPFIQRVRNSSPVERPRVDNNRALSPVPKTWGVAYVTPVGEHCMRLEGVPRGALERMDKQM